MQLEAVTVCVGYADILAETIPANIGNFDRWVIVTTPADEETFHVAHKWGLPCLTTSDFFRDGQKFNKGRAVARGLNSISCSDWVLHLDSDIALPPAFKQSLESAHLDPQTIYGADRMMIVGFDQWLKVRTHPSHQRGYHCYVMPDSRYPIGTRWSSPTDGYVPIGFFQLWNGAEAIRKGTHQKAYPSFHGGASRSDVQFALQWDRRHRQLVPELLVYHLESEPAKTARTGSAARRGSLAPRMFPRHWR